jgi:hypothetical protein
MVAFKYLVIRVTGNLVFIVNKSLVQRQNNRGIALRIFSELASSKVSKYHESVWPEHH